MSVYLIIRSLTQMPSINLFEVSFPGLVSHGPTRSASAAFVAISCFLILHYLLFKKRYSRFLRNLPVLRMLLGLLMTLNQIHDFTVKILGFSGMTFLFKGPPFAGMDMLLTADPDNIHHIMSSNFSNYIKGPGLQEIFDVFGDGIFTTDSELWKNLRKSIQAMLHHQDFQRFSMSTMTSKLKDGLVPLLNHFAEEGTSVDLQDVFGRLTFDTTLILITGSDPRTLSIEMHEDELAKALDDAGKGILSRHVKPRFLWKMQNLMGLGQEKKMNQAKATFDRVCSRYISAKREEITRSQGVLDISNNGEWEDLLTSFMKLDTTKYKLLNPSGDKFLRDTIITYVIAGRDTLAFTLSWFFWLLSENPQVVAKIRQEIMDLPRTGNVKENLDKLVYLQGALFEAMRLYPPVSFGRKSPIKSDVLPSGHKVDANSKIIICLYALGRMRAVWGKDALQFKPERWITESGGLRHEPSSKFLAFNSGPRTCLGKHLAITQMKMVVVEILQKFDVEVIKGQKIEPVLGFILSMKHGLRVTVAKRCST